MGIFSFLNNSGNGAKTLLMTVEDTFEITGRGLVVTGTLENGPVSFNDAVIVNNRTYTIGGIEHNREILKSASAGMSVGLLIKNAASGDIKRGNSLWKQ